MSKPNRGNLNDLSKMLEQFEPAGVEISAVVMVFKPGVNKPEKVLWIGRLDDIKLELNDSSTGFIQRFYRDLEDHQREAFMETIKERK